MTIPAHSSAPTAYGRGALCICRTGLKRSILVVALNRPRVKNAFSDDVYRDLVAIMKDVAEDSSLAVMILTGMGSYFSSGADLKGGTFMNDDGTPRDTLNLPAGRFMMALICFPKILCAAVNGPSVGIGVTLLLHFDLCHCSETATLWAPFTRLALVPELCSSATFMDSMGLSKANEMLLLGKKIDAETSVRWNICSQIHHGANTEDPFHYDSVASRMAREVDKRLLSLPLGDRTGRVFVNLMRKKRQARMERVCLEELKNLDERFNCGDVLEASMQLSLLTKDTSRSRL